MKKAIFLFALILGISGTSAAQSCGNGNYGNGSSYYNTIGSVGKINIRKRNSVDRRWVTEATLIKDRGNKLTLEYILENGDVLTVMAKKNRSGNGNQGNGQYGNNQHGSNQYDDPYILGASNNYYYGASNRNRGNRGGKFDVHCVRLNGRTIANNCGTIRIEPGYGFFSKTFINIDMGRRGTWKGNAEAGKQGRH